MNDKKTLLIIDDNDNNTTLSYLLSCEYDIIPAHSNIDYIKGLNIEFKIISAIILNIQSPEINSLKFLNSLTKSDMFKNIPILVTSALLSQETEVNAFRMGAWDFIHLPITGEVLKYRLDNIISKSQLTAFNQLHYLDDYDKLTGIYNKTKFFHETHKMLTKNPEKEFVFIRFDIVRFKLINSYFGHDEGDKVMKFIANTLKEALKIYKLSLYGRIEADIFGICLN